MFQRAKYIISERGVPVVFSELQQHGNVAHALFGNQEIVGAGFVIVTPSGKYKCFGESISLGVSSRGKEDSKILNNMLGAPEDDL